MGWSMEADDNGLLGGSRDHEGDWLSIIAMNDDYKERYAFQQGNQKNKELPNWCKEEVLQAAKRLGLIEGAGGVSTG